jgi:branched-chain amino acid transport system substrate-binding protein
MEKRWKVKIERKKLLILGVSIVLIMALFSMAFSQESTKSNVKTLQIGWSGSVTGWASIGGVLQWQGAQVARDIINEKGGITIKGQKYQIELVLEDDKSTTDGAVAAANRLVYDKKIKFMSGLALWLAAATKDICEPQKVLRTIIWTCNTPGEIGPDTPYTFLGNNATFEYALATMDYMKRSYPKVKNVTIVTPDDGAQPYLFPNITKWLEQRGISMVGDLIAYPNDMTDFSPIVQKLTASKADALMQVNGLGWMGGQKTYGIKHAVNHLCPILLLDNGQAKFGAWIEVHTP